MKAQETIIRHIKTYFPFYNFGPNKDVLKKKRDNTTLNLIFKNFLLDYTLLKKDFC